MSPRETEYDVFLSYSARDREEVAKVEAFLSLETKLRVFFDVSSLVGGESWQTAIERVIASCRAVIIFQGKGGLGNWQKDEVEFALIAEKERSDLRVIPVLMPGADAALGLLRRKHWIEAKSCWDSATLQALVKAIEVPVGSSVSAPGSEAPDEIPDISPYRGLLPFREEDAPFYFGRESFIQSLRESVECHSLIALEGPSGSGKSSLVHAGLLPDLRKVGSDWRSVSIRPGPHPVFSLARGLASLLEPGKPLEDQEATATALAQSLLLEKESLEDLSARVLDEAGKTGRLLLVVDQWEELYTLAEESEFERDRFIDEILTATQANSISVLILFRGEFYGRVMAHSELRLRLQADRLIPLPEMGKDDLRSAMEKPARKAGLSFDDGLVDEILADLERQPGPLPLLEFVLARLWSQRDKGGRKLLRSSYRAMGGVRGALARKADEITRALPEAEVRRLFLRLVRVEEDAPVTRRRVPLDELNQPTRAIAARFVENRLLVTGWDSKTGEEIIEIAHEALIHHWRRLRAWLEEDRAFLIWREPLEHDVAEWMDNDQASTFLLAEGPLQVAEFWFGNHADDLSPEAHGYIRLSIEKRDRGKRRWKIVRSAAAALVVVLLSLLVIVLYLQAGRDYARSAALAAEADRLADRRFDLALLLALQAGKAKSTAEALGVTLSLTAGNTSLRHFLRLPQSIQKGSSQRLEASRPDEVLAVAYGPEGLIASGGKGRIFLWNAKLGTLQGTPLETGEPSQVVSLAFSPDGSLLASGSENGGWIRLWNIHEGRELDPIPVNDPARNNSVQNLTFDPAGVLLAWSTRSGIYIWDLRRGVEIGGVPREAPATETNWISGLAFAPSGELGWATADGRIWSAEKGQPVANTGGSVMGVAFAPGGAFLTAGDSFRRWDPASGMTIGESCSLLAGAEDEVISVAFSPTQALLASGHLDRKIRLWEISKKGCPLFATLSGHSGLIWSMAFGGEKLGRKFALVSGGEEGDLILWEVDPATPGFSVSLGRRSSPGGLAALTSNSNANLLAVGDSVGQITLYDGKTRKRLDSHETRNLRSVYEMAFSGDGRALAAGGPEGHVILWDVGQRSLRLKSLLRVEGGPDPVRSLAFSRDGAWVAAGTRDGRLLVWQLTTDNGRALPPQKLYNEPILAVAFATETNLLVQMLPFLRRSQKEYLVIGGPDGKLILWDLEENRMVGSKDAHSQVVTSLAAREDGLLASGSLDRNVRLWRLDSGLKNEDTLFFGRRIAELSLSSQGELLAAVGEEGSVKEIVLWNLKARTALGKGFQAPNAIRHVAFDSAGQALFLSGKGISAWWDLRPETWAAQACDMVRRDLSPIEREKYLKPSEQPVKCARVMQGGK